MIFFCLFSLVGLSLCVQLSGGLCEFGSKALQYIMECEQPKKDMVMALGVSFCLSEEESSCTCTPLCTKEGSSKGCLLDHQGK